MKRRNFLAAGPIAGAFAVVSSFEGWGLSNLAVAQEADGEAFDRAKLIERARLLAESAYVEPALDLPGDLADLSFDQYRRISFRPERRIGQDEGLPFNLDLLHSGFIYRTPVSIHMVDDGLARKVVYDPGMFDYGDKLEPPVDDVDLPFSGVRVHFPIHRQDAMNEF